MFHEMVVPAIHDPVSCPFILILTNSIIYNVYYLNKKAPDSRLNLILGINTQHRLFFLFPSSIKLYLYSDVGNGHWAWDYCE